jgi:aryl-alcohol dehydrogenase-like predicted oxidoreductase
MEKRRFGRTGHRSTVAIFGAAALSGVTQAAADKAVEQILAAGLNHIDVAPSYGRAEERLGPWMPRIRDAFFLGCKTMERTKAGAAAELRRSLERLRVDRFDLYQLHAVTSLEELDQAMGPGGALEAVVEAREEGLTDYIGITGHGVDAPAIYLEALRRFDFDSVLFPINFVQYANPAFRETAEKLVSLCRERDVGTMIIKAITRRPWGDRPKIYDTWYEPFDDLEMVQQAIDFALSQDVTGICTAGDVNLLPLCLQACENHEPMSREEQEALIAGAAAYEPLFA